MNPLTGNALYRAFLATYRVGFDDATLPAVATWTDATSPFEAPNNVDPILATDAATGRTFSGGLQGACSTLSFTDDDGATWTPMVNPCSGATADHESIGSGPWRAGPNAAAASYPRAVYYCAQLSFVGCATSYDGGLTFTPPLPVSCGFSNPGLHGSIHVTSNGAVVLPFKNCGGQVGVSISLSNGLTWTGRPIPGATTPAQGFDPDAASTPSGWIYVGFQGADRHPYVSLSKNEGLTWTPPVDVGAALGIQQSTFHEMVAGDDERAAIAFLGSTSPGNGFATNFVGEWHLYVATTLDAGATWTTVQVTTDPVQRGQICAGGTTGCGPVNAPVARNLLDFMDAQVGTDGRVLVAFADGCVAACAQPGGTAAQSSSAVATIARQSCGPSLFAAVGNVEGARVCTFTAPPPPPPPTPLAGTFYGQSDLLVGNVGANPGVTLAGQPDGDSRRLDAAAPTSDVSSVQTAVPLVGGTITGTGLAAQWAMPAPSEGWRLEDATVTVRLFVAAEGLNTRFNVSLYDAGLGMAASAATPQSLANRTMNIGPASPVPVEVLVTFTGVDATLVRGLSVVVENQGAVDTQLYYGSVQHPMSVEVG